MQTVDSRTDKMLHSDCT